MAGLLQFNPAKRINATEALRHNFLSAIAEPPEDPVIPVDLDFDFEDHQLTLEQYRGSSPVFDFAFIYSSSIVHFQTDLSQLRFRLIVSVNSIPLELIYQETLRYHPDPPGNFNSMPQPEGGGDVMDLS